MCIRSALPDRLCSTVDASVEFGAKISKYLFPEACLVVVRYVEHLAEAKSVKATSAHNLDHFCAQPFLVMRFSISYPIQYYRSQI